MVLNEKKRKEEEIEGKKEERAVHKDLSLL